MSQQRLIQTLAIIQKIKDSKLEQLKVKWAELQAYHDTLEAQLRNCLTQRENELKIVSLDSKMTLSFFLEDSFQQEKELNHKLSELAIHMDTIQEEIRF